MYNNLQIIETDYNDKYLIKYGEKTMYVGFIIRDIIELLIKGNNKIEIHSVISQKYSSDIDLSSISDIIDNKINAFIEKKQVKSFVKVTKLFNPNNIPIHEKIFEIFEPLFFYATTISFSLISIFIYFFSNHDKLSSVSERFVFYPTLFAILILHELGHSICAKKNKVEVNEIGFGLYFILPVFYVDLNESWKLDKNKRVIINLAGIYFQLIIGILLYLASFLFKSQQNLLMNLFFSNFTIIILNLNPFLKFDGYWIMSDLLNVNDLNKVSNKLIKGFFKFEFNKDKPILIVYSFLRMLFVSWILILLSKSFYSSIVLLFTTEHLEWYNFLPIGIMLFFLYRLLTPILNKIK